MSIAAGFDIKRYQRDRLHRAKRLKLLCSKVDGLLDQRSRLSNTTRVLHEENRDLVEEIRRLQEENRALRAKWEVMESKLRSCKLKVDMRLGGVE
jgi:chromosome segregation ATPase